METHNVFEKLETIELLIRELTLPKKEMLSHGEASKFLNVSGSNLYKLTSTGQLPYYCPNGKKLYFKSSELALWMQKNRKADQQEISSKASAYILERRVK
jgi:excisionase family DNA binding protein